MQQAIYNSITGNSINTSGSTIQATKTNRAGNKSAPKASGLVRWVARWWDMLGVVALMGSSVAYGVFALAHVGL